MAVRSAGSTEQVSSEPEPARSDAHRIVVIGASAGGLAALLTVLGQLPKSYPLPVVIAQHLHNTDGGRFAEHLDDSLAIRVVQARDKERIAAGHAYVAPADYHLLLERDGTLALSVDPKVNWSRPSIDVLLESAARAWGDAVIGVILSGASTDGAVGMRCIREHGGFCVAQDPDTAESPLMPRAAIEAARVENVLAPVGIGALLLQLTEACPKGSVRGEVVK